MYGQGAGQAGESAQLKEMFNIVWKLSERSWPRNFPTRTRFQWLPTWCRYPPRMNGFDLWYSSTSSILYSLPRLHEDDGVRNKCSRAFITELRKNRKEASNGQEEENLTSLFLSASAGPTEARVVFGQAAQLSVRPSRARARACARRPERAGLSAWACALVHARSCMLALHTCLRSRTCTEVRCSTHPTSTRP